MEGRCFVSSTIAAEAEGRYQISADARDGSARATIEVEVVSEDLSGLIAERVRDGDDESGRDSSVPATPALGGGTGGVAAAAPSRGRSALWWGIAGLGGIGLLGLALAAFALWWRRRQTVAAAGAVEGAEAKRRAAAAHVGERESRLSSVIPGAAPLPGEAKSSASAPAPAGPAPASPPSEPLYCPQCGTQGTGSSRFCATHGAALVPAREHPDRAQGMICPTCRQGHPPDATRCAKDGTALVPYAIYRQQAGGQERGERTCATCGTRYPANITFCGKDGTPLG